MDFKKEFFKYFQYWPWFLLSLIISLGAAFLFIKSVSPTYETTAVIFLDKKKEEKTQIITISSDQKSKDDNLEDEIRLITSNDFLLKVVKNLNFNISYFQKVYNIQNSYLNAVPFVLYPTVSNDSLPQIAYDIKLDQQGFIIVDPATKQTFNSNGYDGKQVIAGLPFSIQLSGKAKQDSSAYFDNEYVVRLEPTAVVLNNLKESLVVLPDENSKGTLELFHKGTSPIRSRQILNEIISLFDKYIVINKQKSFKNTVAYLNQRIKSFSKEKDSIESAKENFLKNNDILVMDSYIVDKTKDKYDKNESSMLNERQIALTYNAINDIKSSSITSALGTDYNLESPSVNQMLMNYNSRLLESELILQRAQKNNPAYISLVSQLRVQKQAILNSLEGYLSLLKQNNKVNRSEQSIANSAAKSIPTKDRILGNINSKLGMKEETYVLLLQKREEAILNGAILESNLTTLNSPATNYSPVFPQPKPFMLGAFLFGLLIPFGIVYLKLQLDTKIHNEDDIQNKYPNIPFLGTIPVIDTKEILDNSANSRSIIAEATRTLYSNISYLLPTVKEKKGNVILFTSSFQGEGKSFSAFHNAITISNLNKKVLLIGVDLRNPQLHEYFNIDKDVLGLTNYLSNKSEDWKKFLIKDSNFSENMDTLFAGEIPPNPTQLLTNSNFETLIEEAKGIYDFIILDSAPVQMVSDTFNFSQLADVTVFVTKYNFTDKSTLNQVNNFIKKEQLKNVGIIINEVSTRSTYGYNYGYSYGYQYQDSKLKKPWYKKVFS
ncbi:polysaccharide biosynthesis tyrosine autokinase [Flavobacterium cellulosilyticum]|uniref:Polysaccharide biosynthesis tyrosine autokinase n=1 Tax=Flavobacterium cellulosilyticum TaxID=2541731 RepID=A0A4R5C927_9FLAO|nr:polysaccharide biosynthesis tyrosine autokinase [Flavobacterium cellulosilyticum]TDD94690.1 polysaccharide biosynthesis tyrosine autokinase [Flavobacterium cellulosilyticum]